MRRSIFHFVLRLGTCSQRQRGQGEACEKLEKEAGESRAGHSCWANSVGSSSWAALLERQGQGAACPGK